jgi:hypothetical protein
MSSERAADEIFHAAAARITRLPTPGERLQAWQALQEKIERVTILESEVKSLERI